MKIDFVPLIFGVIFFATGVALLLKQIKSKLKNTESAIATVVYYETEVSHSSRHGRSVVYYPVMQYDALGETCESRSSYGSGKEKYLVGEEVEILFDPDQPEQFIVAGDKTVYIVSAVVMLMGLVVCYLAVFAN